MVFWGYWFPPKNELTNSTLLLWYIHTSSRLVFVGVLAGENLRHQKTISKLTDLYLFHKFSGERGSNLMWPWRWPMVLFSSLLNLQLNCIGTLLINVANSILKNRQNIVAKKSNHFTSDQMTAGRICCHI